MDHIARPLDMKNPNVHPNIFGVVLSIKCLVGCGNSVRPVYAIHLITSLSKMRYGNLIAGVFITLWSLEEINYLYT